jgi:hypothetical protein
MASGTSPPELLFGYLAEAVPITANPADAVVGFGHFDLRIADTCARLFAEGRARRILLTGGVGAGTADLGRPEAQVLGERVRRQLPALGEEELICEDRSANTGENVRFLQALLAARGLALGGALRDVILVATPARMRRVRLTWRRWVPEGGVGCHPPPSDAATDDALFRAKGLDYGAQLAGEVERIVDYAARGWIAKEAVPPEVLDGCARLRRGSP